MESCGTPFLKSLRKGNAAMPYFQLSTLYILFLDYCTAFFNPDLQLVILLARKQISTSAPWSKSENIIRSTVQICSVDICCMSGVWNSAYHIYIVYKLQTIEILLAVDGQNSAPGGIYETLNITRETIYRLVAGTCPSSVSTHINPPGRAAAD